MDVLNTLWAQVKQIWGGLSPAQRTTGLVLVGLLVAALAGSAAWSGRTDYVPLFPEPLESPEQIGSVLRVLKGADIDARQEKGQILVPAAAKDRAFMELSGKNAWPQDQTTVEMKGDADDWKLSDPARRDRARRSLQARLARMVSMVEGVQSATVLLAEGNNNPFGAERYEPKATVQVHLKPQVESLPPSVADTIRRVVAYGVTGIKPATVAVADTKGRFYEETPRDDDQAVMTTLEKLERDLEKDLVLKVHNALAPLAGSRIAVEADVVLDRSRQKIHERKVNPDETVVREERAESRTSTSADRRAEGVPGTASNVTAADAGDAAAPATNLTEEKSEAFRDYSVKDIETLKGAGDLKQVTVGVLVPYAKGAAEPDAKTVDTYRGFVMKAAGITDPQFVTVSAIPYDPAPVVEVPAWRSALELAAAHADQILLAVLAVGALLLLGRVLRLAVPAPASAAAPEGPAGVSGAMDAITRAAQGLEPLPESSPEAARYAELETRVREMVRKDPRISAGLVKRWLMTGAGR